MEGAPVDEVSRHAGEGADVLRRYGGWLARVIHVSLGTNDDPGRPARFRAPSTSVMDVAGSDAAAWCGRTSCARPTGA